MPQSDADQQACEVPLVEQLRSIPKDYRTCRAIQWSDDGRETGHQFIPVGYMMHRAADEIDRLRATPPTTNNVEPRELASGHFHVWKEKWKDGSMIGQECFCGAERDVKQSAQNDTAKPAGDGGITKLYHELLYQVATKHPGETRHETALRYIRNAERGSNQTQASQSGDDNEGAAPEKRNG